MILEILTLVLLLMLNAMFAMAEIAILTAKESKLEAEANDGDRKAKLALKIKREPHLLLASVQVGITLNNIIASVYGGVALSERLSDVLQHVPYLGSYASPIAYTFIVVVITLSTVVLGELVPKSIAISYPETLAKALAPIMSSMLTFFAPVIKLLDYSSNFFQKLFGIKVKDEDSITEDEISFIIAKGSQDGVIEEAEEVMVRKVFKLGDRPAYSIMTPRKDIFWLDINDSPEKIWEEVSKSEYSYFPVADNSVENILGVISAKDVSSFLLSKETSKITDFTKDPLKVPANTTVLKVLELFKNNRKQIALVIDEYGDIDGLITKHDLMEAIVGDLDDNENEGPPYVRRKDGSLLVDAGIDLDDLFTLLELSSSFDNDDHKGYHSLGGFVLKQLGHMPSESEKFEFDDFTFEVVDMDGYRVDKVLIQKKPQV